MSVCSSICMTGSVNVLNTLTQLFWIRNFPLLFRLFWLFRRFFQISVFIFFFNDNSMLLVDHSIQWMPYTSPSSGISLCMIFTLNFLDFDFFILDFCKILFIKLRFRFPSSLIIIQYYWWITTNALLLCRAMSVPEYLLEHHLACDLFWKCFAPLEK